MLLIDLLGLFHTMPYTAPHSSDRPFLKHFLSILIGAEPHQDSSGQRPPCEESGLEGNPSRQWL